MAIDQESLVGAISGGGSAGLDVGKASWPISFRLLSYWNITAATTTIAREALRVP